MTDFLRIAGIIKESIVDGPGIRLVVFSQGCKHNCKGCHNPETHSFTGGRLINIEDILEMVKDNPLLDGITFSGGEPLEQAENFAALGERIKEMGLNVITYTGYTYEKIIESFHDRPGWERLMKCTDILIDGPFEIDKKSLMLKFRGSSNQRIIDMKASILCGKPIVITP
ncbi:MAG: anaerobic ribonucleoside-triphosphate reductase activating protein [Tissierellaceae bacterium]|jgi:anaerobic ribonucleoside-triphosphate reductase activating protein|nr:anaerobic ribonucleoside-triphosphate reductase activating protein [Tissierellaceae bacterium]